MEPKRYQHGLVRSENARFGFKIIKFCHGLSNGRDFYAFVAIEPHNLGYFENHYTDYYHSDFSAFGQEILRGWGETPPEDIIDYIKLKHSIEFGVDPAYLLHLARLTLQTRERDVNSFRPFPKQEYQEYPEKPAEAYGS